MYSHRGEEPTLAPPAPHTVTKLPPLPTQGLDAAWQVSVLSLKGPDEESLGDVVPRHHLLFLGCSNGLSQLENISVTDILKTHSHDLPRPILYCSVLYFDQLFYNLPNYNVEQRS